MYRRAWSQVTDNSDELNPSGGNSGDPLPAHRTTGMGFVPGPMGNQGVLQYPHCLERAMFPGRLPCRITPYVPILSSDPTAYEI